MLSVSTNGCVTHAGCSQVQTTSTSTPGVGQSAPGFEFNGTVYYNCSPSALWHPQTATSAVVPSRIVTMVHPSIVHNNIPSPPMQNNLLFGHPPALLPHQNSYIHDTRLVESFHCNLQGGVGGVFYGQQVTQHQPVIFMGLPGGGEFS